MNDTVRDTIRKQMKARRMTQQALAERVKVKQPSIARLLAGVSPNTPPLMQKVLDELGLELVAVPRRVTTTVTHRPTAEAEATRGALKSAREGGMVYRGKKADEGKDEPVGIADVNEYEEGA